MWWSASRSGSHFAPVIRITGQTDFRRTNAVHAVWACAGYKSFTKIVAALFDYFLGEYGKIGVGEAVEKRRFRFDEINLYRPVVNHAQSRNGRGFPGGAIRFTGRL